MTTKTTSAKKPVKTLAKTPVKTTLETPVETSVETAVAAAKKTVESAANGYEQAVAMTQKQVEKTMAMTQDYGDLAAIGKENVEAAISSGSLIVKGFEVLGKEWASFARQSVEGNVAATTAIFGAKTLNEVVDLQNDYARKSFDQFVEESAKLTELSVKVANEALAPIQTRVNLAVEQITKTVSV